MFHVKQGPEPDRCACSSVVIPRPLRSFLRAPGRGDKIVPRETILWVGAVAQSTWARTGSTHRTPEKGYADVGDTDFESAEEASAIHPVPGGVGARPSTVLLT